MEINSKHKHHNTAHQVRPDTAESSHHNSAAETG